MLGLRQIQEHMNKVIARENKKYILKKLEEYYEAVNCDISLCPREQAIFTFWEAKKQGRLDNLNRLNKKL